MARRSDPPYKPRRMTRRYVTWHIPIERQNQNTDIHTHTYIYIIIAPCFHWTKNPATVTSTQELVMGIWLGLSERPGIRVMLAQMPGGRSSSG